MMKRLGIHILATALFALALALAVGQPGAADTCMAQTKPAALAVYQNTALVKTFTMAELEQMEDPKEYTYSAFNSFPSVKTAKRVSGVRVDAILAKAGIDAASDGRTIQFIGSDGAGETFLMKQLMATRYYFPNISRESGRNGAAPLAVSWNGQLTVPAMISLDEPYGGSDQEGRLLFGQLSPTEQNYSGFVKYLARGDKEVDDQTGVGTGSNKIGRIIVSTGSAKKWNAIRRTSAGAGGVVKTGTALTLDRTVNGNPAVVSDRYCVYFTTDGSAPGLSSSLYNYNNFNFGQANEKLNRPVISAAGTFTLKTKVIGYGREDSAVSAMSFTGVQPPAAPKFKKISRSGKKATLKWKKVSGANGYKIYRATKKNVPNTLVKTINKAKTVSWKNKKLKKKKTYYYKITSFKRVNGTDIDSAFSAVKKIRIK